MYPTKAQNTQRNFLSALSGPVCRQPGLWENLFSYKTRQFTVNIIINRPA